MYIIVGLGVGILLGMLAPITVSADYSRYIGVGILAAFDALLGALNAKMHNRFKASILVSGFFGNALIAMGLTYLGELLDVDLYIAAVVVFGTRLFQNFAEMRRKLLTASNKEDTIRKD